MYNIIFCNIAALCDLKMFCHYDHQDFKRLQVFMEECLKCENNRLNFIFECYGSGSYEDCDMSVTTMIDLFNTLVYDLNEEQAKRVQFYIYDDGYSNHLATDIVKFYTENKENAILEILSKYPENCTITMFGCSSADIDALLKIEELGGTSYLVNKFEFLNHKCSADELITDLYYNYLFTKTLPFTSHFKCSQHKFMTSPEYSKYFIPIEQESLLYREELEKLTRNELEELCNFNQFVEVYSILKENVYHNKIDKIECQKKLQKKLKLIGYEKVWTTLESCTNKKVTF